MRRSETQIACSTAARTFTIAATLAPSRRSGGVDDLNGPGMTFDDDLVSELDRPRHQGDSEVVGCGLVEHADGDPGNTRQLTLRVLLGGS